MSEYVRADGGTLIKFPYTLHDLRADYPDVSFPREATDDLMAEYGACPVLPSEPETPQGKQAVPADPAYSDGEWRQGWAFEDAPRREVPKWLIVSRLTDQQLEDAFALMSLRQVERWRAAAFPNIHADDPEMLAILSAVGADAETVLAP